MNSKISNPFLKQLISGISQQANQGRISNISWSTLSEGKKSLKKEASVDDEINAAIGGGGAAQPAGDANAAAQPSAGGAEQPAAAAGGDAAAAAGGEAGGEAGADPLAGAEGGKEAGAEAGGDEAGGDEDPDQAQADAVKAKAELEKAKAEKDQAEEELKNQSYIKLKSSSGTRFLLGKILNHAFRTNTIDALAAEMVQKLNIKTKDDVASFSQDVSTFKVLPGMPELITSMEAMAEKQPTEPSAGGEE